MALFSPDIEGEVNKDSSKIIPGVDITYGSPEAHIPLLLRGN